MKPLGNTPKRAANPAASPFKTCSNGPRGCCAITPKCAAIFKIATAVCSSMSFKTRTPSKPKCCRISQARTWKKPIGANSRRAPAVCSWSAMANNRSTGFAAPMSRPLTSSARALPRPVVASSISTRVFAHSAISAIGSTRHLNPCSPRMTIAIKPNSRRYSNSNRMAEMSLPRAAFQSPRSIATTEAKSHLETQSGSQISSRRPSKAKRNLMARAKTPRSAPRHRRAIFSS